MAKISRCLFCVLLLCHCHYSGVSQTRVTEAYLSQLGVREATGSNDGIDVEKYLHSVGLPKGYSWCAAFVHWCLQEGGIETKISGWAPTAHNGKNLVWFKRKFFQDPQADDVFTIYFPKLKRVAHTGFFYKKINGTVFLSVEGNTNEAGSREGDGVYKKYRSFNSIHSITRWP